MNSLKFEKLDATFDCKDAAKKYNVPVAEKAQRFFELLRISNLEMKNFQMIRLFASYIKQLPSVKVTEKERKQYNDMQKKMDKKMFEFEVRDHYNVYGRF